MTDAMERLAEKVALQKTIAVNLKKRFLEASEIAIEHGYCIDELQNFGQKAFREILATMRAKELEMVE